MDVTGNTSDTNNMLSGTKGTAANGTSVTGTIVATPVDDTLSTTSHNAIENAAVATALASKADSSAIPDSTSDLTNDSNFVSDSSYVHTDNNFTTTLKNKLDGIAANATVDDHKWNDVSLTKSTGTTSNNIYVPYMTSTSGTGANLATASTTPTAHYIAKYDANKRLYSTTPTAGDDSTKVATTAFVQSAISALGSVLNYKGTKSTVSNLPATGNTTGDVWIVTADSSEHVWNGSSWEQLGTTVDLSGYALASSIPDSTSDLTNDSGFLTSSDLPSWSQASTKPSYTASEVGAATSSHVHGNITNSGDITGNVTIASGDRLVINDESASKINNSSITFGSSTTTFLANNGTWQTPSGVVTSVNGSTGAVTVSVPSASTTAPSMDGTASYGSGTDYARANHVHPSDTAKVSKSGDTVTGTLTIGSGGNLAFTVNSTSSALSFNTAVNPDTDSQYIVGNFSVPVQIGGIKDPTLSTQIANKNYVDTTRVAKTGDSMTGNLSFSSTKGITFNAASYNTTLSFNSGNATQVWGSFSTPAQISGIATPTQDTEIANKEYVDTYVPKILSRQNLVNNWYFVGGGSQLGVGIFPINQRGQTSYTVEGYCIDRWYNQRTTHTLTLQSGCIHWERVNNVGYNPLFYQPVNVVQGEVYTYSILYRSTFRKLRETFTSTLLPEASDWTLYSKTATASGTTVNVGIQDISYNQGLDDTGKYIEIKAIKLEPGTQQTLAHQDGSAWVLNEIPNYEAEIIKCQPFLTTLSRYSAWRATSLNANEVRFYVSIPSTMRSTTPTLVNGTNFAVRGWGGSNETGFSFEISGVFKNAIQIKASKTSHGLTDAILLANTGDVLVSAE